MTNRGPLDREPAAGRRITLEAINETTDLAVPARRVESALAAGLRVPWIEYGEHTFDDGLTVTYDVTCGAGVGSPYLILHVVDADQKVYAQEVVDIRDLVSRWIDRVERDGRTPEDATPQNPMTARAV